MFLALSYAPKDALVYRHLPLVERQLQLLAPSEKGELNPKAYKGGEDAFWDDYCLGYFMMGSCWKTVAYPVLPLISRS